MSKIKFIYGHKEHLQKVLDDNGVKRGDFENLSKLLNESSIITHVHKAEGEGVTVTGDPQNKNQKRKITNLVVESSEYSSANEHVLINDNIVFSRYDIDNVFLHNPPDIVRENIENMFDSNDLEDIPYEYKGVDENQIRLINSEFDSTILGQKQVKDKILAALVSLLDSEKPVVMLFYGSSGVGKTETAKLLAKLLEGEANSLFRRQFSMFQNQHFANYLFGGSHSERSFARELLERRSNIILIDEFDKVDPYFHNAFYQLFDEGTFVDRNYTVNLKKSIIICTSNYHSEASVKERLGDPIFSRFDSCIKFQDLTSEVKNQIVEKIINEELQRLSEETKSKIKVDELKTAANNFANSVGNYRTIRNFIKEVLAMYRLDKIISSDEAVN